ncbi:Cfr10I/Bse634I family restriction endonuclease [Profundibacterium mesophilum]|uniref:I restriction endonuclease n=1 Tax=Profundibacterium mesophilum KAUST100406-0324 TaxID=1037889 RepID=A0A921NQ01_9RHOB|nr:Cfr10I/Bse634I family restriction endonuclease [Profundibacterium mesophilum]KAF0675907.1 I restriction endonuclease [Profundibacterium mesophilum KAUST100406-0324]
MPFTFPAAPHADSQASVCAACHAAGTGCLLDVRQVKNNRSTKFQITQHRLLACAFESFTPGSIGDPDPTRTFKAYREQGYKNLEEAGKIIFPSDFELTTAQKGKVDGDVFEMLEAAALWNVAAAWNSFMDTGVWSHPTLKKPQGAVPTPKRKVAIIKMPRGGDTTQLLTPSARAEYQAFEASLSGRGMELRLSTPDILGMRIPDPAPPGFEIFDRPIPNLTIASQQRIERALDTVRGAFEGRHFLFAIAVKTSVRSDRLYQALFEANVLKYILGYVLRGPAIRFYAHMESLEGADVRGRYSAASMTSLLTGGTPTRAIDETYQALKPLETSQRVLDDLPTYVL